MTKILRLPFFITAFFSFYCNISIACEPGHLCISICGSAERECDSRPDAANDGFGNLNSKVKPGDSAKTVALDKNTKVERIPATESTPIAPPSGAPSTAATETVKTYAGFSSPEAWCNSLPPPTTAFGCGTTRSSGVLPDTRAFCYQNYSTNYSSCGPTGVCACAANYQPVSNSTGCPNGYTLSGTTCNLSDARAVIADSKYDFSRSSTTLTPASSNDKDAPNFITNESVSHIIGGSIQRSGFSPSRNPSHVQVTPLADGGSLVVYTESANDQIRQNTIIISNSGSVISNTSALASGTLVSSQSSGTATFNSSATVANPGTGGSSGGTSSGLSQTGSTEGTQNEIKDAIKNDIQAANDAKTALGSGPTQPSYEASELNLPNQASFQVAPTEGMEALLPVNSGDCVTYPLNLPYFSGLVLDPCDVIDQVRPLVDWAVIAFGLLAGLFIWFGKSAEPA